MRFEQTAGGARLQDRVETFLRDRIIPAESIHQEQLALAGDPYSQPRIIEDLKEQARAEGLWNLFYFDEASGVGLSNVAYAPLAEIMGQSAIAPEIFNCAAPDTGNMEILARFGTEAQRETWLQPLLDGQTRSAFAMTERFVASSDASNIELRITREGDEYVFNGRKWWTSNALHPHCRVLIVMGKTDPGAQAHRQQSMVIVPIDSPGVTVMRGLTVFGYADPGGHAEVDFDNVRVPVDNLLGTEGEGFAIAQSRLGPGRIHHCMRMLGAAERALQLMCLRASDRSTFGQPVLERDNVRDWIAESRIEIEMARALVMRTAWLIDTASAREARVEIAAIKVAVPAIALKVIDRAIQVHGAGGVSQDFPLASMWAHVRSLRIADGPDEVHKRSVARAEIARQQRAS